MSEGEEQRRARGSNPQPVSRHHISNVAASHSLTLRNSVFRLVSPCVAPFAWGTQHGAGPKAAASDGESTLPRAWRKLAPWSPGGGRSWSGGGSRWGPSARLRGRRPRIRLHLVLRPAGRRDRGLCQAGRGSEREWKTTLWPLIGRLCRNPHAKEDRFLDSADAGNEH